MRAMLLVAAALTAAADYPKPAEADVVLKDFRFSSGETLDLKVHYRTVGRPRRDREGKVVNAVPFVPARSSLLRDQGTLNPMNATCRRGQVRRPPRPCFPGVARVGGLQEP